MRSATDLADINTFLHEVSIHALLAECDGVTFQHHADSSPFQSTHSLRSATSSVPLLAATEPFQSTHSLRSATLVRHPIATMPPVSIHALLAECDKKGNDYEQSDNCFNPRTPCGVRQSTPHSLSFKTQVSIHALLAECDCSLKTWEARSRSFNPRTPCGVRLAEVAENLVTVKVSIHALLAECDGTIKQ